MGTDRVSSPVWTVGNNIRKKLDFIASLIVASIIFGLIFMFFHGSAIAQENVPVGGDIPEKIIAGKYNLNLLGSATWNSQVFINSSPRSSLFINGNNNVVTLLANHTSLFRDFSINNNVSVVNTIFKPLTSYPNQSDYLIGIATSGITTNLNFAGTTFSGFNRTDNRGATILYAYVSGSAVTVDGGAAGVAFYGNRAEWDAGGAVAVAFSTLNFTGNVTFDSNWTGNYGGAVVVYDFKNSLNFNGATRFANNHAVVFGGAMDVWGGQATVAFNGVTTFDGNYIFYEQDVNSFDSPRHINDQHARGGAINIGYIASAGGGASVTFNERVAFSNNYVVSTGTRVNNQNALGGAISVYGNGVAQNYRLLFNSGALFQGNYVYAATGTGNGGAIYYDSAASQLSLASGTRFLGNYAKTYGGAIYLQAGTINLNATADDIVFQGNRHGVQFDSPYKPIAGSGAPNAIYLGGGGTLNLNASAGQQILFYDPIASVAGSSVTVNKLGDGEVVFYGDGTASGAYDSAIQANTTVQSGSFILAEGVKYGSSTFGTFSVQNGGMVGGGGNAALLARTLTVANGGTLGVTGGIFDIASSSITLRDGSSIVGDGTLTAGSNINIAGTVSATIADSQTLNVVGNIAGTGGLNKTGDGTLVLSAANIYTGATVISGGTLAGGTDNAFSRSASVTVNAGGTLDTGGYNQLAVNLDGAGDIVLDGGGVLTAQNAAATTFSGTISGSGSLLKTGGGVLTLSGDNIYGGGTSIAGGQVTATTGTALGTGTAAISGGAALNLNFAGDQSMTNRLTGAGTVNMVGTGTARLTGAGSSVGAVNATSGTVSLEQIGEFAARTYTTGTGATTSLGSHATLAVGDVFTQSIGSTLVVAAGDNEPAITAKTAQLDGDLYITGFSILPTFAKASRFNGTSYTVIATDNGITGDFDNYYIGAAGDLADYLTITGRKTNDDKNYTITLGLAWFAGPVYGSGTFTLGNASDIFNVDEVLDNQMSSSTGWTGTDLTKKGAGTLVLSKQNAYTGVTDIQAGTLRTDSEKAFSQSSAVTVGAGATLDLNGNDQVARNLSGSGDIVLGSAVLTVRNSADTSFDGSLGGAGGLVKTGGGQLSLTGVNTYGGGTTVSEGTLLATGASALGGGAVDIESAGTLNLQFSADQILANGITGAGALVQSGTGITTLTASGSSAGAVTVRSGSLAFGHTGGFSAAGDYTTMTGAATAIGENATLVVGGAFTQQSGSNLNIAVGENNQPAVSSTSATIAGALDITGFGADAFRRASAVPGKSYAVISTTGGIAGDFDSVSIGTTGDPVDYLTVAGSKSADFMTYSVYFGLTWYAGNVLGDGKFTLANATDAFTVDVILADEAGSAATGWNGRDLTKLGDGTLTLSRINTYTGDTIIGAGTLATGIANAFADSSAVSLASGATLALNNHNQTANNLTGAGTIALGSAALTLNNTTDTTFRGVITGTGSLNKTGTGRLTLSGASAYSGGATVAAGAVTAESGSALGTGTASVQSDATLELAFATDQIFANKLAGSGTLEKTGRGVAHLTAADSVAGTVAVTDGTVSLEQTGVFSTTGAYSTASGATTALSGNSSLQVGTVFTQESGSSLDVAIGIGNDPAVSAASASIAGTLNITGLGPLTRASDATRRFTVISTDDGIQGNFGTVNIDAVSPVDYLAVAGDITGDGKNYVVGMGLTWLAGPVLGNGVFTLSDAGDAFEVDDILADQGPASGTGWDGKTLTKAGDGTLTLAGGNTYTGDTIVNGGTLAAIVDSAFAYSASVTVNAGGTLDLNGTSQTARNFAGAGAVNLDDATLTVLSAADTTFSGVIFGDGELVKAGVDNLTLSGINTYGGGTTITEGTLLAANGSAVGTGAVAIAEEGAFTLDFGADQTFTNRLSGEGTLVNAGSVAATLTAAGSSVGTVQVSGGELALAQSGAFTAGNYTTDSGAATSIGGASRLVAQTFVQEAGSTLNIAVGSGAYPDVTAVDATIGGTLNVTGFSGGVYGDAQSLTGNRYTVVSASGTLSGDFANVTIGGSSAPVDYLVIDGFLETNSYQVGFGLAWEAGVGESTGNFTLASGDSFNVNVVLGDETAWAGWNGSDLTKLGAGTLTLSSANTFSGTTNIQEGTLATGGADVFKYSSEIAVASGATLALGNNNQIANNLAGAGSIALGTAVLTVNNSADSIFSGNIGGAGELVKTGTSALTLSGNSSYSGGTTVSGGTLVATAGGALGTGKATIGGAGVLNLAVADDQIFVNQLDGTGTLTKTGGGVAHLTASGSRTGAVTVADGELSLEQAGSFTAGSYAAGSGAMTSLNAGSTMLVSGMFTQATGATLNIAADVGNGPAISAATAVIGGTLNVSGFGTGAPIVRASDVPTDRFVVIATTGGLSGSFDDVTIGPAVDPTDYLTVTGVQDADSYAVGFGLTWFAGSAKGNGIFTLSGPDDIFTVDTVALTDQDGSAPFGTGWSGKDLTKGGAGALVLSQVNTYTGVTAVNAGTLRINAVDGIADSTEVVVADGAMLAFNSNQTLQNLSGAGLVELGSAKLTAQNSGASNFSGVIDGAGSLEKTGAGELSLSGANTYSGGTAITAGTIVAGTGSSLGTGAVAIGAGATLDLGFSGDETLANSLNGDGSLVMSGTGTAHLTATGSAVEEVTVAGGELSFRQSGAFDVTGDYATDNGAATSIGSESTLAVAGAFTQDSGSTLNVDIGQNNQPAVHAGSATLAGTLNVSGFGGADLASSSRLISSEFVVVESDAPLSGNFNTVNISSGGSPVDYLVVTGTKNPNTYVVGFGLTWFAGSVLGNGVFTIADASDTFTLDTVLDDQSASLTGWNGMDLTKQGQGTLILAEENQYTGATLIAEGTLRTHVVDAFANSTSVTVDAGATLALGGKNQLAKDLAGEGTVALDGALLTVQSNNDTAFLGDITGPGRVSKTGNGILTLSGDNTYDQGTSITDGGVIAAAGSALGTGAVDMATGTSLELRFDTDQTLSNRIAGSGAIAKTGTGTARLTGQDSSAGAINVMAGTLALEQNGALTADSLTTESGATTTLGTAATLTLGGALTQQSGSSLNIGIGAGPGASITAGSASLAGTLNISGFDTSLPASALTARRHTVLESGAAIAGDFDLVDFGGALTGVDYLLLDGHVDSGGSSYSVGFTLTWNAGPVDANGVFTLSDPSSTFDIDVQLADRAGITSGWNGRDLTKNGAGTLILSVANSYRGSTTVNGGTLSLAADGALGFTSELAIASGAAVTLDNTAQSVGLLTAQGGATINLGTGTLTITDSQRDSGDPDVSTLSDGTLAGSGSLVLQASYLDVSGANGQFTGNVAAAGGSAIVLDNAAGLGLSGGLTLTAAVDSLTFAGAGSSSASDIFGKSLTGAGGVALTSDSDVTLTGNNAAFSGNIDIAGGATLRASAADHLGAAAIVDNGNLILSSATAWRLDNAIAGSGVFTKDGGGQLLVDTALRGFGGSTMVANGALIVGDTASPSASIGGTGIEVAAAGTLSGAGTVGDVVNRGTLSALNALSGYQGAGAANFTTGRLLNAGVINLAGGSVGNTLTVSGGLASQSGRMIINTVLGGDNSPTDKLILDGGATSGTTSLVVHNVGGGGAATTIGIPVVETINGATTGADSFALDSLSRGFRAGFGTVAAGAYDYRLLRGGNGGIVNNWYLVSALGTGTVRPEAGSYLANREAAESIFLTTMHDRLEGYEAYIDPLTGEKWQGRAWGRVRFARGRYSAGGGLRSTTKTMLVHTGVDLARFSAGAFGTFRAGIMAGLGTARSNTDMTNGGMSGKGNFTGYFGGVYATWFQRQEPDEGLYVDSWLQHSWFRNRISGSGLPGEKYHSRLWSASLEAGYAIPVLRTSSTAWSIIPTAQMVYHDFDAGNFTETSGTIIRQRNNGNLLTRIGARIQGRVQAGGRIPAEPYIEANWHHKTRTGSIGMNEDIVRTDSPRNHYEIKIGVSAELKKGFDLGLEFFGQLGAKRYREYGGQLSLSKEW